MFFWPQNWCQKVPGPKCWPEISKSDFWGKPGVSSNMQSPAPGMLISSSADPNYIESRVIRPMFCKNHRLPTHIFRFPPAKIQRSGLQVFWFLQSQVFLEQCQVFLEQSQLFLEQSQLFLEQSNSFWSNAKSFRSKAKSFWSKAKSFWSKAKSFWSKAKFCFLEQSQVLSGAAPGLSGSKPSSFWSKAKFFCSGAKE